MKFSLHTQAQNCAQIPNRKSHFEKPADENWLKVFVFMHDLREVDEKKRICSSSQTVIQYTVFPQICVDQSNFVECQN